MTTKTIREIALAWKSDKQRYVKQSTYAAYVLVLENHILPSFGDCEALSEKLVQEFRFAETQWRTQHQNREGHSDCPENGDEVRSKERMDELLRVGYQIPYD